MCARKCHNRFWFSLSKYPKLIQVVCFRSLFPFNFCVIDLLICRKGLAFSRQVPTFLQLWLSTRSNPCHTPSSDICDCLRELWTRWERQWHLLAYKLTESKRFLSIAMLSCAEVWTDHEVIKERNLFSVNDWGVVKEILLGHPRRSELQHQRCGKLKHRTVENSYRLSHQFWFGRPTCWEFCVWLVLAESIVLWSRKYLLLAWIKVKNSWCLESEIW